MGRYKKIKIQGLLIDNFGDIFFESLNKIISSTDYSEEEILIKIASNIDEIIASYEDTLSTHCIDNHKFNLNLFLKSHFRFQEKTAKAHQDSFVGFIMYIHVCFNVYEKILLKLRRKRVDNTLKLTVALYGLSIRRAYEILNQLLSGYIDGAMILWRSLYENAIILLVLAIEDDPELSDKFYHHSVRNSKKKFENYQKNYKALKFKKLSERSERIIQQQTEELKQKYGIDFLNNEFGWADTLFPGNKKANFRELEEKVEMTKYRPYYLCCCEQVHSNFNGFKNFMKGNQVILDNLLKLDDDLVSFIDPMQFTIGILEEINDYILYEFSMEDELNFNKLLMNKIFEKQQNTFNKMNKNPKK